MGLVISLSQVMILHQFYVIIVEFEHVASIMKVVILSNPLQHVVVRQGELQLSKQFFFLLRHSLQRVATRQGEL
jgi:hypothetical protein